ncbi:glycosyltransferase involved in cell wall biosynthesis [Bacillus pakistanensis]|uniref:Glycosyltransferase involved in cell wall biosynthesis n=1 Tax=Rossellomorea pakistanensis TaxID=992288 RepID=A0ABS2NGG6_9BACI|nr:glycosyltransferase [Bacillus pakistanensis]MBM7586929.1 glycosyltransferase involved in cell wall biosynthesis [Bacillus pakistanensis]
MKILFVYYVPSGGVETHNRQRRAALKNYQCEFLYYRKQRELINDHHAPVYITNEDNKIKQILLKGNYDAAVIISDYGALPRLINLGFKGKLIYEIQGLGAKNKATKVLTAAKPIVSKYADGLLNPRTPHITKLFNTLFPNTPKFNFNNCLDWKQYSYKILPKHPNPIVAWIGRIEDNKNWREFLLIGHRLVQDNPNIELYMFEDPTLSTREERESFAAMRKKLNIDKNLTVFSNIPNKDMSHYFSKIGDSGGFLCITSKVEGAPYAPLEAMSSRCPILTTDCDGIQTAVVHNQTGKYYTIGDINSAFKQAKELMTNSSLTEKIRTNALTHVQNNFSLERYNHNFTTMLNSIVSKK